jgi:hypothetical protein
VTWPARTLTTLYTATTLWLAYCTIATWNHVPAWTTATMIAASLAPIAAGLRETFHADDMRNLRVQLERATRPAGPAVTFTEAQRQLLNRLDDDLKDNA